MPTYQKNGIIIQADLAHNYLPAIEKADNLIGLRISDKDFNHVDIVINLTHLNYQKILYCFTKIKLDSNDVYALTQWLEKAKCLQDFDTGEFSKTYPPFGMG